MDGMVAYGSGACLWGGLVGGGSEVNVQGAMFWTETQVSKAGGGPGGCPDGAFSILADVER